MGLKLIDYFKKKIIEIKEKKLIDENFEFYEKLFKLNIYRKLVKFFVMVKFYNVFLF